MSSSEWRELDPFGYLDDKYLDEPAAWDVLATVLRAARVFGLDSEFYGLDVRKESCVQRARIHVWSVAVRTAKRSPLGFHYAVGWCLPSAALAHAGLRAVLEDPSIQKDLHNQPVDDHAFHNHGIELAGCLNTLNRSRWAWPWLKTQGGFGLKNLMMLKLRRDIVCTFKQLVGDVRQVEVSKVKKVKKTLCSCGVAGCRARKGHEKTKIVEEVVETKLKDEDFEHPLESIVPGHKRFELLVRYAIEDAVAAVESDELADREKDPAPFPYGGARPAFNQDVENSVVLMEREGFPVDTGYASEMVKKALEQEETELAWLHSWYVYNGALTYGPHRREEVDAIWSSPKQLAELFDELEFPRSPVWKKGKVKRDEIKLDSTALKWIARNYKPAKQMIEHLLQLKKIRAGKKYMTKLSNSGGWVNIICGPAGDEDDRNGAVTGRLGIKGTLEAQQLPTKEEVDLYQVRRAIVATDIRQEVNEAGNLRVA